jgi:hypothetical protein
MSLEALRLRPGILAYVTSLGLAAAALPAQRTTGDGPELASAALAPTSSFKYFASGGSVRLVGWDRDSISVHGHGRSDDFHFAAGPNGAKLAIEDRDGHRAKPIHLVIYFPRHGIVAVRTVTASITASDLAGTFVSVSGMVHISGAASSVDAEAMDGGLDLDVVAPWIRARTGQGHLLIRGAPQDVDASTISGPLDIATPAILRGRFASVTGDIRYDSAPAPASLFDFSNHGGAIDFLLPQLASARFDLSSVTGAIENGFVQVRPAAIGPHNLRLTIGRGESQISVRTFKGAIRLRPR